MRTRSSARINDLVASRESHIFNAGESVCGASGAARTRAECWIDLHMQSRPGRTPIQYGVEGIGRAQGRFIEIDEWN